MLLDAFLIAILLFKPIPLSSSAIPLAILLFLAICLALSLVLFATLTVEIGENRLELRFGPGLIRKSFSSRDIESVRAVKNPWYYGWGIHLTPQGWLYNLSGSHAVEITLQNGKRYRIGTDVPDELEQAIRQAIEMQRGGI